MNNTLLFIPVVAHIFLVFGVYGLLWFRKLKAAKSGAVDLKPTALNCKAWNDEVVKVSNNLDNQFEAPVLFYALCFVLYSLGDVSCLTLIFAWLFVLSRALHVYIHTGSNYVPHRMKIFSLGIVALLAMALTAACKLAPLV